VIKFAFGFPSPKRGRKLSDEDQAELDEAPIVAMEAGLALQE
jgi:hypothetical protein